MLEPPLTYGGFCRQCQKNHTLPSDPVVEEAKRLIEELEETQTIQADGPLFSTDHLFGATRGQMFGVMLTHDSSGEKHLLKAFSGQFRGHYHVQGWVPPVFDLDAFQRINTPGEKEIKSLGKQLAKTDDPTRQQTIKQERRLLSQILMKKIHGLYILKNFRGKQQPMSSFFPKDKGMPTGAGDCCAPKLIQHAINQNLTPLGMAEFYFGLENKSATRQHGHFYASCTANCAPILGFMLCGLEDRLLGCSLLGY